MSDFGDQLRFCFFLVPFGAWRASPVFFQFRGPRRPLRGGFPNLFSREAGLGRTLLVCDVYSRLALFFFGRFYPPKFLRSTPKARRLFREVPFSFPPSVGPSNKMIIEFYDGTPLYPTLTNRTGQLRRSPLPRGDLSFFLSRACSWRHLRIRLSADFCQCYGSPSLKQTLPLGDSCPFFLSTPSRSNTLSCPAFLLSPCLAHSTPWFDTTPCSTSPLIFF